VQLEFIPTVFPPFFFYLVLFLGAVDKTFYHSCMFPSFVFSFFKRKKKKVSFNADTLMMMMKNSWKNY
jgi:hypothetical protein